jgi:hypothetical protein
MGTIKQGILGGVSGKVAGIVGTSWKGIAVIKAMPLSVANPQTAGQVEQRSNFGAVVIIASFLLASVIKPLWDRFASAMSGYNAFVSANVDKFTAGVLTSFSTFQISTGKMAATAGNSVSGSNNSGMAGVAWTSGAGQGYKLASDLGYIVIYNETQDVWSICATNPLRSAEAVQVTLNTASHTSDKLHLYIAFKRADGTIVSETGYATSTV